MLNDDYIQFLLGFCFRSNWCIETFRVQKRGTAKALDGKNRGGGENERIDDL